MGRNHTLAKSIALLGMVLLTSQPSLASAETLPSNWRSMVDAKLADYLADPYSAVVTVTREPRFGAVKAGFMNTWYGWAACYSINAKNPFGAYVGARQFVFVFDETKVIGVIDPSGDPRGAAPLIERECGMPADAHETKASASSNPKTDL